jgi:hypothetical protein
MMDKILQFELQEKIVSFAPEIIFDKKLIGKDGKSIPFLKLSPLEFARQV